MKLFTIFFVVIGATIGFFLLYFSISSLREKRYRATVLALIILVLFILAWAVVYIYFPMNFPFLFISIKILFIITLLFFIPIGKTTSISISANNDKVDERDTMFAREEYQSDTEKYENYYNDHPELKHIDDKIRALPELLGIGSRYYDPDVAEEIKTIFMTIKSLTTKVDGESSTFTFDINPDNITQHIKKMVKNLGADDVGIAVLNPAYIYSNVGRGPEPWGQPIENTHKYAIAFTLEMDYHAVETSPRLPTVMESAIQYLRGALISVSLAKFIREIGYPARAHISDSNYQIMLPPVAHDAGLGELGRMGYLISPRLGARIRLGAVTTDLPLIPDRPIVFGVQDFCKICKKCAINCPSKAIPEGEKIIVRGTEKWQLNIERCIHFWRVAGTDCGICMKVCPYSHPPTFMHNMVRAGIKRSIFARYVSAWADDFFYGK